MLEKLQSPVCNVTVHPQRNTSNDISGRHWVVLSFGSQESYTAYSVFLGRNIQMSIRFMLRWLLLHREECFNKPHSMTIRKQEDVCVCVCRWGCVCTCMSMCVLGSTLFFACLANAWYLNCQPYRMGTPYHHNHT